jgi:hypothetical protein
VTGLTMLGRSQGRRPTASRCCSGWPGNRDAARFCPLRSWPSSGRSGRSSCADQQRRLDSSSGGTLPHWLRLSVQWPGGCTSRRCLYGSTHQPNRGVKWNFGRGGAGGAAPVGSAGGGAGASRTVATAAAVGAAASRRSNDAILLSRSALSSQRTRSPRPRPRRATIAPYIYSIHAAANWAKLSCTPDIYT